MHVAAGEGHAGRGRRREKEREGEGRRRTADGGRRTEGADGGRRPGGGHGASRCPRRLAPRVALLVWPPSAAGAGHRVACHALSSPQSRERMGPCGKISVTFRIRRMYRTN